ncbi:Zinc finger and BTB domain containing 8 opposite strand [Paragonimus heterotremus]|uniref:Zinc finger and BTB domain containing 8 opposite strand n=1 Tax=Paragonimus heterotremus TaxID=100268 RepID=A0A8J4SM36_9TREM|nr:Zinc finger and BTB domain containing 8 opposite strand [Paragonimus heterotremus]
MENQNGLDKPDIPDTKYEYLDHTADVQLHSWGDSLAEAFEQVRNIVFLIISFFQIAMAMFGYMTTNYDTVEMLETFETEAEGHDGLSLLFHFLDEWLFAFSAEPYFIPRVVKITEFDFENFRIKSVGWGEPFQLGKHPQGTEVKAITYSNMQIHERPDMHELFVIIDI